ncbi:Hypothetical predicted protein [Lecanosticta acicola]|uniref:F-box domain-containing protein n=1 Tax=Lecanosticta acicola TaxID=111012 RepID=A0AAI8Z814_9PEZI|nr:Hypothetical predicted protein [Lecanosticta acicola]
MASPSAPNDVWLIVRGHLDIDTFLAFRLTCRKYYELINSHMTGLTEAVAASTFPHQTRILQHDCSRGLSSPAMSLSWLKGRRLQQLTAIVLESNRERAIMAEDPLGDEARAQRVAGWKILLRLHSIEREVQGLTTDEILSIHLPQEDADPEEVDISVRISRIKEVEICRRRCYFIKTLSFDDMWAYHALKDFIQVEVLGYPWHEPWKTEPGTLDLESFPWVWQQVLHDGPDIFWKVWWSRGSTGADDTLPIKHKYEKSWRDRDPSSTPSARDAARVMDRTIGRVLNRYFGSLSTIHGRDYTLPQMPGSPGPGIEERRRWMEIGEPTPGPTFADVSVKQTLSCQIMGEAPWLEEGGEDGARRRRRRSMHCGPSSKYPMPSLNSDPVHGARRPLLLLLLL